MKSVIFAITILTCLNLFAADRPCAEDAKKFCAESKGDRKAMMKCMKDHEAELSPACKEKAMGIKEKVREKMTNMKENCMDDVKKFCSDVKPGHGGMLNCLKSHQAELSPKCQATFKK